LNLRYPLITLGANWLVFIIFLLGPFANSAELKATKKLTLSDAVQIAMENSPYLKAVRQQSAADQTHEQEARSYRLPQVDLNAAYMRTNSPMEVFALELSQETFSMQDFFAADPNHPSPITDAMTQLRVSQPLYMGGRITAGIHAGEKMGEAAEYKLTRAKQTVVYQTRKAYLDTMLAQRFVELMNQVAKTVSEHVNQASAYYDTGFIMEADLLQAQVALADIQQKQITAENNADLARAFLNNTMGVPQDELYELDSPGDFERNELPALEALVPVGLDNRPDLLAMRARVDASRYNIDVEKSGYKPKVFLVGELNYHDADLGGFDGDSFKVMAMATYNLFNGKRTRSKVKRAKAQSDAAREMLKQMEEGVILQIRQAHARAQEAAKRYHVAELSAKQAANNLQIRQQRYEKGVERTTDLLDADAAYERARTLKLKARFDYLKALESLDYAIGKTRNDI